jgi:hypothetical protein
MSNIIEAVDLINQARQLVEAIEMAAGRLPRERAAPIQAVAVIASDRLKEASQMILTSNKGDAS